MAANTVDTLAGRLLDHARTRPEHDAVVTPATTLSYKTLADRVRARAATLATAGITVDSVAGISCADDIIHLELCLAVAYLGATSISLPAHDGQAANNNLMRAAGVTHLVDTSAVTCCAAADSSPSLPATANCSYLLFATSGTTGEPKLVIHDGSDLVAQAHRHVESPGERFACLASMEHNFARRHRLYCVAEGATNVFTDAEPSGLPAQCRELRIGTIHVSAFQARELLAIADNGALAGIRLKLGGSHVTETLRAQLREHLTPWLQAGYGTTETGAIAFTDPDDRDAADSVGRPLPGIEVRIVSSDRTTTLGPDKHGELAIRCDGMFRGYLGNPEQTADRLVDGWFYTGDIGYLDNEGRIHLSGRADDMFVFNSMNIYPQDIETEICSYPGVTDAAVLPRHSSVHGDIPIALVVFSATAPRTRLRKLQKFVRNHVGVRCPRQFMIVDQIPRNAAGKIIRSAALELSTRNDDVRKTIVSSLDTRTIAHLKPAMIDSFERGEADITLREIGMDSLARMELLIALEVRHDAVIDPREFARLGSLGKIAARVVALQSGTLQSGTMESPGSLPVSAACAMDADAALYVVRFFQRIFSFCRTVAQLNKALVTLEHRLTPAEIVQLHDRHTRKLLFPDNTAAKFHLAFEQWLADVLRMMDDSGKTAPEPFSARRIAPAVMQFAGPGSTAKKTLLVCFAVKGGRTLMMPNAVLLQHTDATRYDLLVIGEPLNDRYQSGVPYIGRTVREVLGWLADLSLTSQYKNVRTLGSSAGGYPAVLAGYVLGAELAVSVGGRFHSARHPGKILNRILTTWRVARNQRSARVLLCYGKDKTRDRNFARLTGALTGASLVAIELSHEKVGHAIFERLVERGELAMFLERTVFADCDDELVTTASPHLIFSLPSAAIRACE